MERATMRRSPHPPFSIEVEPRTDLRRLQLPQRQSAVLVTGLSRQWVARIGGSVRRVLPTTEETPL